MLAWVDATAGVAGDMLLAALLDAGAEPKAVGAAVAAVLGDEVSLTHAEVTRGGLRARQVRVEATAARVPHRSWSDVRRMLVEAALADGVRARALAAFTRLADAEAAVHGIDVDSVHFHEVGAWDSIADVVGMCAALNDLAVDELLVSSVELGSGHVRTDHGRLPVPAPAVVALAAGWYVTGALPGECATPTGMAVLVALGRQATLPPMILQRTGVGAGQRDSDDHPNVVRVLLGQSHQRSDSRREVAGGGDGEDQSGGGAESLVMLEATVDDLDPRIWPTVIDDLLHRGALDAWLTPVLMKKGRPGHVLSTLVHPEHLLEVKERIFTTTSTLGVRESAVRREHLERCWVDVEVAVPDTTRRGATGVEVIRGTGVVSIAVKIGHRHGVILQATPEFDAVCAALADSGQHSIQDLLAATNAASHARGLVPGARVPGDARPAPHHS